MFCVYIKYAYRHNKGVNKMLWCVNCGVDLDDDSNYCDCCGAMVQKVSVSIVQETVACKQKSTIVGEFAKQIKDIDERKIETTVNERRNRNYKIRVALDKQKFDLLRRFVVPIDKDDLLEFIILAYEQKNIIPESNLTKAELKYYESIKAVWQKKFDYSIKYAEKHYGDTLEYERLRRKYFPYKRQRYKGKV